MKKDRLRIFCDEIWLEIDYAIALLSLVGLVYYWPHLTTPTRVVWLLTLALPAHVFEENSWPGGFFYMNNRSFGSKDPMTYPQSALTNMITNLGAELAFLAWIPFADRIPNAMVVGVIFFCLMEVFNHTRDGVKFRRLLKDRGKQTSYGPGSATSYLLMLPLSAYGWRWLATQTVTGGQVAAGIGLVFLVLFPLVMVPLGISAKVQSPRFAFRDKGYFKKFD